MNAIVIAVILFTIIGVCVYIYSKQASTPSPTPQVIQTTSPTPYSNVMPSSSSSTTIAPVTAAPNTVAPKTVAEPTPSATPFFQTYTPAPKINCVVSDWTDTSTCNAKCNSTGTKNQKRTVTTQLSNGGDACPVLEQSVSCTNTTLCPVDCVMNDWTDTSTCTGSCGNGIGTKTQSRTVKTAESNGGKCDVSLTQTISCTNNTLCPVDCVMNDWTDTSTCTSSCGGGTNGTKNQSRTVKTEASNGGKCNFPLTQTISCTNATLCPVDCVMNDWTDTSTCTSSCGGGTNGTKNQSRTVKTAASNGGKCNFPLTQTISCTNNTPCPKLDCVGNWSDWGSCSATSGQGTQTKRFNITTNPQFGGAACPTIQTQTQNCCAPGWIGSSCQFSNATTCGNNGTVDANGNCSCNNGYAGQVCQFSNATTCNNRGNVDANGNCSCVNYTSNADGQSKAYLGAKCQLSDDMCQNGSVLDESIGCHFIVNSGDIICIGTPDGRVLKGANIGHEGEYIFASQFTRGPNANSYFRFIGGNYNAPRSGRLQFVGGDFDGKFLTAQTSQLTTCCGDRGGTGNFDCNTHHVLTIKSFGNFADASIVTFVPNGDNTFKMYLGAQQKWPDTDYLGEERVCERNSDGSLHQDGYERNGGNNQASHQLAGFGIGRRVVAGGYNFYIQKKGKDGNYYICDQVQV